MVNILRPRFSLLTLLLVISIVALAATVVVQRRNLRPLMIELGALREENGALRTEVGALSIGDPTKLHVIAVPVEGQYVWKWRVWVPAGQSVAVRVRHGAIPEKGVPQAPQCTLGLSEGEHVIRYTVQRDSQDGSWGASLRTESGGCSTGVGVVPWPEWDDWDSVGDGVGAKTVVGEPKKPLVLLRHRVGSDSKAWVQDGPAAGVMIWIEMHP